MSTVLNVVQHKTKDDLFYFYSHSPFSVSTKLEAKTWDGIIEYSFDRQTWTVFNYYDIVERTEATGGRIYFRGIGNKYVVGTENVDGFFKFSGQDIYCKGELGILLDYNWFTNAIYTNQQMPNYCFYKLFADCTQLVSAPRLTYLYPTPTCIAPFKAMFSGCTNLVSVFELPTGMTCEECYALMFYNCSSLKQAPLINSVYTATKCYYRMFEGCTSLLAAPSLPADYLASYCYARMFYGCTSLVSSPDLPFTATADYCCSAMFQGCTSLKKAPALPAYKNMKPYCYDHMFYGCTALTTVPVLSAETLAEGVYQFMFALCTSLQIPAALPATTLAQRCYHSMFRSCTSLNVISALIATHVPGRYTEGASTSDPDAISIGTAESAYDYMFSGCTNIKMSTIKTAQCGIKWRLPYNPNYSLTVDSFSWANTLLRGTGGPVKSVSQDTTYYTQAVIIPDGRIHRTVAS